MGHGGIDHGARRSGLGTLPTGPSVWIFPLAAHACSYTIRPWRRIAIPAICVSTQHGRVDCGYTRRCVQARSAQARHRGRKRERPLSCCPRQFNPPGFPSEKSFPLGKNQLELVAKPEKRLLALQRRTRKEKRATIAPPAGWWRTSGRTARREPSARSGSAAPVSCHARTASVRGRGRCDGNVGSRTQNRCVCLLTVAQLAP